MSQTAVRVIDLAVTVGAPPGARCRFRWLVPASRTAHAHGTLAGMSRFLLPGPPTASA
jgi:hypothetical protein